MKKHLIKIVLATVIYSINVNGFAQDTIQQWNVGVYDRNWMPPITTQPFWSTNLYKTEGDTLINSITYKKLYKSNDSQFNQSVYLGAIRRTQGKIFITKTNSEYLLYDFNLNIDDTTQIYRFYNDSLFAWKVKISSISDTIINNRKLKKYNVAYSDTSNSFYPVDNDVWIDEIGSKKYGLLNEAIPSNLTGPDKDFYLLCYKENNEIVLHNTNFNTCFKENVVNIITNKSINQCSIHPTHLTSNTHVAVESSNLITQINIFNMQGTLVFFTKAGASNCNLDLSYLNNGFYIVFVNNNTFKLLITR